MYCPCFIVRRASKQDATTSSLCHLTYEHRLSTCLEQRRDAFVLQLLPYD